MSENSSGFPYLANPMFADSSREENEFEEMTPEVRELNVRAWNEFHTRLRASHLAKLRKSVSELRTASEVSRYFEKVLLTDPLVNSYVQLAKIHCLDPIAALQLVISALTEQTEELKKLLANEVNNRARPFMANIPK